MCGRFVQSIDEHDWQSIQATLGVAPGPVPQARYNLAPSQAMVGFRWSPKEANVPPGPRQQSFVFGMRAAQGIVINARSETVTERRMFRGLLEHERALVVASAFYEWAPGVRGDSKQPHCFARSDGRPFFFAALHRRTSGDAMGAVLLTTQANAAVASVHARMPVMLDAQDARHWLDGRAPVHEVLPMLGPYAGRMRTWPVSRAVNSAHYDAPDCMRCTSSETTAE